MKNVLISTLAALPALVVADGAHAADQYQRGLTFRSQAYLIDPFAFSAQFVERAPPRALGLSGSTHAEDRFMPVAISQFTIGYGYSVRLALEGDYTRRTAAASLPVFGVASLIPANARSVGLDAVRSQPLWSGLSLIGRAGVRRLVIEDDSHHFQQTGVLNQAKLGLGLQYQYSGSLGFRAEVERYRNLGADRAFADSDGDAYRFGVWWRF